MRENLTASMETIAHSIMNRQLLMIEMKKKTRRRKKIAILNRKVAKIIFLFLIAQFWATYALKSQHRFLSEDRKIGYLSDNGDTIIKPIFDNIGYVGEFSDGYAVVSYEDLYGVIDENGEYSISPQYEYLWRGGRYVAGKLNDSIWIERVDGKIVGRRPYEECLAYHSLSYRESRGLFLICENHEYGVIDTCGNVVLPIEYTSIYIGDWIRIQKDGLFGLADRSGNMIIPMEYTSLRMPLSGNLVATKGGVYKVEVNNVEGGKWGIIDTMGRVIVPFELDAISHVGEYDLMVYHMGDERGWIHTDGRKLHYSTAYEGVSIFSEGLAVLCVDGKCGYIDTTFQYVLPPIYQEALPFAHGKALVVKFEEDKWRWVEIDENGTVLRELE